MRDPRYQFQPWYVKVWRRRHYLMIPCVAVSIWLKGHDTWPHAWSIAIGTAQIKMQWTWKVDECRQRFPCSK